jgi:AcrR family transcriptional regulator
MSERVDAARNRARVLDAAARLFAEAGVDEVSMEDVARAAGVGKATLYRRYADKGELSAALIDADARVLQAEVLAGLPSAGSYATPRERLERLLRLLAGFVDRHSPLIAVARRRRDGLTTPGYQWMRQALRAWLRQAELAGELAPDCDIEYLADALLAPLTPDLWLHQRVELGMSHERLAEGLLTLVPWSERSA